MDQIKIYPLNNNELKISKRNGKKLDVIKSSFNIEKNTLYKNKKEFIELLKKKADQEINYYKKLKIKPTSKNIKNFNLKNINGFLIEVKDGKIYFKYENEYHKHKYNRYTNEYKFEDKNTPTETKRIQTLINYLTSIHEKQKLPNGLCALIDVNDHPNILCDEYPILVQCKNKLCKGGIPYPDFTFHNWNDLKIKGYFEIIELKKSKCVKYSNRIDKVMFRGVPSHYSRIVGDIISDHNPHFFDISVLKGNIGSISGKDSYIKKFSQYIELEDHDKWKYLIHYPGNSYSGRFKNLMAMKSTVIKVEEANIPYYEFFYHTLIPMYHYIPFTYNLKMKENVFLYNKLNEETDIKIINYLSKYKEKEYNKYKKLILELIIFDKEAEEIAKNGQNYCIQYLTQDVIELYYRYILQKIYINFCK